MQTSLILDAACLQYKNTSQRIRVASESWVKKNIFCPSCGEYLDKYPNNKPVADFFCRRCTEDYELKSKSNKIGQKIVDGSYSAMMSRLENTQNPSLFLLSYSLSNHDILDYLVIPKYFFLSSIIEKRKPLSTTAKRSGWVGCNIVLSKVPDTGKIFYIKNRKPVPKIEILNNWQRVAFLKQEKKESKGWLIDTMACIDKLSKREFILDDIYAFERELKAKHPDNQHVKDKIRQQLQILRDKGYLHFLSRGRYRID